MNEWLNFPGRTSPILFKFVWVKQQVVEVWNLFSVSVETTVQNCRKNHKLWSWSCVCRSCGPPNDSSRGPRFMYLRVVFSIVTIFALYFNRDFLSSDLVFCVALWIHKMTLSVVTLCSGGAACSSLNCSHVCLLTSVSSARCVCPDGLKLDSTRRRCTGALTSSVLYYD